MDLRAVPSLTGAHACLYRRNACYDGLLIARLAFEDLGAPSSHVHQPLTVTVLRRLAPHFVEDRQRRFGIAGEPGARRLATVKLAQQRTQSEAPSDLTCPGCVRVCEVKSSEDAAGAGDTFHDLCGLDLVAHRLGALDERLAELDVLRVLAGTPLQLET